MKQVFHNIPLPILRLLVLLPKEAELLNKGSSHFLIRVVKVGLPMLGKSQKVPLFDAISLWAGLSTLLLLI